MDTVFFPILVYALLSIAKSVQVNGLNQTMVCLVYSFRFFLRPSLYIYILCCYLLLSIILDNKVLEIYIFKCLRNMIFEN